MNEKIAVGKSLIIQMNKPDDDGAIDIAKALGSEPRMRLLAFLGTQVANASEIAERLDMPLSTVAMHLNVLEKAGLVKSETVAATRGIQKIKSQLYDTIIFHLPGRKRFTKQETSTWELPISAFTDLDIGSPCGLASEDRIIGHLDDPASFYEADRAKAQIIWFHHGYVEYRFPYRPSISRSPKNLQLRVEICSEAPTHHLDWPSDIFVEINGVTIGEWTSPADFGGERGTLTPDWWELWATQYGLLKTWRIDREGTWIDGTPLSSVTIDQVMADITLPYLQVRIGVRADAENVGGLNIFGKKFGNHPQDIMLQFNF